MARRSPDKRKLPESIQEKYRTSVQQCCGTKKNSARSKCRAATGSSRPAGASPTFTFPDVAIGESVTLQVRVWDSAKFNSWAAAVAGGEYGGSWPFTYTGPLADSPPDAYYLENLRACCPGMPQPALRILNAGVIAGQVHFNLTGPPGQSVIVEASTDLLIWLPIWTNSMTPDLNFNDVQSGVASHRFYRARLP